MFMDPDQPLLREHNEELMHEAQRWHLQSSLRKYRDHPLDTRPQVDGSRTDTGVFDMEQKGGAHFTLELRNESPVRDWRSWLWLFLGRL